MPDHFLQVDDLSAEELTEVLELAAEMKHRQRTGNRTRTLPNHTLGMLFEKPSTRTRVSFETGMTQLDGHAIFLGPDDTQLSRGEPIKDTSRVVSRYVDAIMARVFDHEDIVELAEYASVPVVNGLSDVAHPCQTLGDLLTIQEEFGTLDVDVAWLGDGNNVAQSLAVGAALTELDLTVVTPPEHELSPETLERVEKHGGVKTRTNPRSIDGSDVVYTDVWVSMGEEEKRDEKLADFDGYQVRDEILPEEAVVMHCLPAHRGEEITDGVMESDQTVVWRQAENRMHAQKALLWKLLN